MSIVSELLPIKKFHSWNTQAVYYALGKLLACLIGRIFLLVLACVITESVTFHTMYISLSAQTTQECGLMGVDRMG